MLRLYDFGGSANYNAYTHLAGDAGIELADYPAVEAWLRRVEARPGFMNDLEPYPQHAGSGGRSAHG